MFSEYSIIRSLLFLLFPCTAWSSVLLSDLLSIMLLLKTWSFFLFVELFDYTYPFFVSLFPLPLYIFCCSFVINPKQVWLSTLYAATRRRPCNALFPHQVKTPSQQQFKRRADKAICFLYWLQGTPRKKKRTATHAISIHSFTSCTVSYHSSPYLQL